MIRPPVISGDKPSPLAALALTLKLMSQNRAALGGLVSSVSDYATAMEDLEMAVRENVVVGLRSRWVRRVAVPVIHAQRALEKDGEDREKARAALDILRQCTDENVKAECSNWLRERYDVR